MASRTQQRPDAPVEHANEKHHRRLIAVRANSSLTTNGSVPMSRATPFPGSAVTGTYTIDLNDYYVICSGNGYTVTLPTAVDNDWREYTIKYTGTGTITVDADGTETIDGDTTKILSPKDAMKVVSDGANWQIV